MADKRKAESSIVESVYTFLVSAGHAASAKQLLKEAKLDEKKVKASSPEDLAEVFASYSSQKRAAPATAAPATKKAKVAESSSEESSSEDEAPKKVVAVVAKKAESSSEESSSEDEAPKKAVVAVVAKKAAAVVAKKAESSSEESSSEDEAPKKAVVPVVAKKAAAPVKAAKKEESSSEESSSEDEAPKKAVVAVVAKKAATPVKAAKKEESSSEESSSEDEAPKKAVVAVVAKKAATPVKAAKKEESSSEESSSEDEAPVAKKATAVAATPVKKAAAPAVVSTPAPADASEESGNKENKIYIKGLPWKVADYELTDFFKACGKTTSVELPMGEDGRATGTAYVKFAKRSELEAALALDGQYWPNTERWLKIVEGFEKPERKSFGSGVKPEGCNTVFVGNLSWDVDEAAMYELFGTCGEVERVRLATGEDGAFKGFGHVQFVDGNCTEEAVKLAGTPLCGREIRVDYAPPRDRESFGGGGRGGRGEGRGAGRGGRDGGRGGRDGGRGGRGGGRGTPVNKGKGSIAVSSGKKMTFGDDE